MHSAAFAALGMSHVYELADIKSPQLRTTVGALREPDCLGANVTVRFKERVMALVDEADDISTAAGALNTIVNRDGRLIGSNTDVPAIEDEIRVLRPEPRHVVILGAGGASRAVQLALSKFAAPDVLVVSRTGAQGTIAWSDLPEALANADLLVNATPVGMGEPRTPVKSELLHDGVAVLDLVYRPSPTRLVHDARSRGLEARAGAGVLLGQGWRSLEAWLGMEVGDDIKRAMADALAAELGDGVDA
jgi:shikimate dehydrogenase